MKGRIEQPLSPARWEKLMKFYQLFFGFFFLIFALVLYWDHVFALGTLFLILALSLLPLKLFGRISNMELSLIRFFCAVGILIIFLTEIVG